MFHYACSIVNSTEWPLLSVEDQNRVNEFGLFIEMRMPRIAPPRLSSASSHNYCKRSSSVGIYSSHPERELIRNETILVPERARSMERIRGGVDGRAGSSRRTSRQISGGFYSRPSSLAIQVEEENLYESDQTSVATTTTVQLENELTTQIGTKNDQKLEKETGTKISEKTTEKNSPNNKNLKDPKQFVTEKEIENIQSTSTTTIDCSDQSLQNLENQKSLKENELSNTEDKNDENFEEKISENLIINEQIEGKEGSKEEDIQANPDRRQSVPSITLRNRQRTHTILNVDRKSIAAAAHQHSNVLIANNASNTEIKKNAAKPHSIVRPMPKVSNGQATISTSEATTPESSSAPSTIPLERRERRTSKQPTNIASTSINKFGKIETKVQKKQTGGVTQGVPQQQQQRVGQQKSGIKKPTTVTRK
ncbi:unnamed protein product [Meloidogyne enterolobii]|uniref:Uncharacterized protein n=1 Tax=Meloidogyne enterolobii TaxID=390850 RepID=A0ACB1AVK9_MELEN